MAKADLHVHSKYSNHPSEWFLKRIGASESYTDPETIYRTAKENGMQFVTLTDHNCIDGALLLKDRHPVDFIVGMEATAYFPEDRCKIHVLVYGINEDEYREIQRLRANIYELRDYIQTNDIAYSVAHATYSVNGMLTADHLEKLILLFDVFEGLNGARSRLSNSSWRYILSGLTPAHIERLANRHGIEPFGVNSWIKGFTGGSDDHAGLFMGKTYTTAEAANIGEFLAGIRNRRSICEGRYSDYQSLAFTIYKIAYDFSKTKSDTLSQTLLSQITKSVFESGALSLKERFKLKTMKTFRSRSNGNELHERSWELLQDIASGQKASIEEKLNGFYDILATISDEFFKILLTSLEGDLRRGDILRVTKNISSSLPGIFLTIPFFSTLKHLHQGKHTTEELSRRLNIDSEGQSKRILWFTDTLSYMNGVSITVKKIGWLSYLMGKHLTIVTSMPEKEMPSDVPPNVINLPFFFEFRLPHYEHYRMRVPCLLKSIKQFYHYEPDEIFISTPGPVGLFGLLAAKLLNAKSIGVFHTDFTLQAHELIEDGALDSLVESYLKWFHSLTDENHVPTEEYIRLLSERGYERAGMKVFRRGIDSLQFSPRDSGRSFIRDKWGVSDGPILLYAGRISKDKKIGFLMEVHELLARNIPSVNLIVAGDGPDLSELRKAYEHNRRIVFTGMLGHDVLPEVYSGADLFVFPSATDTFGMVVLEAQSCGLPALVSDRGGPKEIIVDGETGLIAREGDASDWMGKIHALLEKIELEPDRYLAMRRASRHNAVSRFDWNVVIDNITGHGASSAPLNPGGIPPKSGFSE